MKRPAATMRLGVKPHNDDAVSEPKEGNALIGGDADASRGAAAVRGERAKPLRRYSGPFDLSS